MALRRNSERREALRAELERKDREASARLAAVSAQARQPALFCQQCEAKLKPDATACHYCGSADLGTSQPSCPRFSEVAVNGACPKCHGASFKEAGMAGTGTADSFLVRGTLGMDIALLDALSPHDVISCVTCGARFRRG